MGIHEDVIDRAGATPLSIGLNKVFYPLEISGSQGGGMTDPDTYKIKQHPFPTTGKKTIDIRDDPRVGY